MVALGSIQCESWWILWESLGIVGSPAESVRVVGID